MSHSGRPFSHWGISPFNLFLLPLPRRLGNNFLSLPCQSENTLEKISKGFPHEQRHRQTVLQPSRSALAIVTTPPPFSLFGALCVPVCKSVWVVSRSGCTWDWPGPFSSLSPLTHWPGGVRASSLPCAFRFLFCLFDVYVLLYF